MFQFLDVDSCCVFSAFFFSRASLSNRYSTLQMLSWQAEYLDYHAEMRRNLSKPAFVVPIVSSARLGRGVSGFPLLNFLFVWMCIQTWLY